MAAFGDIECNPNPPVTVEVCTGSGRGLPRTTVRAAIRYGKP